MKGTWGSGQSQARYSEYDITSGETGSGPSNTRCAVLRNRPKNGKVSLCKATREFELRARKTWDFFLKIQNMI